MALIAIIKLIPVSMKKIGMNTSLSKTLQDCFQSKILWKMAGVKSI